MVHTDTINSTTPPGISFSSHNFICLKSERSIITSKLSAGHYMLTKTKKNFFSIISSLAIGKITLQLLLPTQFATNVNNLTAEKIDKESKLRPAIWGIEANLYDLQIVLGVTIFPKGISFVLGETMNTSFATYNVFQAKPTQWRRQNTSVYQFSKPFVAIAIENSNFIQFAASTLQQWTMHW